MSTEPRKRQSASSFLKSLVVVPIYIHVDNPAWKFLIASPDGIRANGQRVWKSDVEVKIGARPEFGTIVIERWRIQKWGLAGCLSRKELAPHYDEPTRKAWFDHMCAAVKADRELWRGGRKSSIPAGVVGGVYTSFGT